MEGLMELVLRQWLHLQVFQMSVAVIKCGIAVGWPAREEDELNWSFCTS